MWRLAVLGTLAGCFTPSAPAGAPCAAGRLCPEGLSCEATADGDRCLPGPGDVGDDAAVVDDQTGDDAAVDQTPVSDGSPPLTCTPGTLLAGGMDVADQGWDVVKSGTGTIALLSGLTELKTTGGTSRQMLVLRNAVPLDDPFAIDFDLQVVASGGNSIGSASIAAMISFHDPVGDDVDRQRMLFLETDRWGVSDGSTSIGQATTERRVYRLERTDTGAWRLSVGGVVIAKSGFTTNGTIAIGDQTTAAGLDSTFRIASIVRSCP